MIRKTLALFALTLACARVVAQAPDAANPALLAAAQAKLAWRLMEKLESADPTVSPASLASAMSLVELGADAKMAAAIAQTLGFSAGDSAKGMAALRAARAKIAGEASDIVQMADQVVFSPNASPRPLALAGLQQMGVPHSVEDLSTPEAVARIDAWVKAVTKGAIPEILGGPVNNASFIALNALHFKAQWKTPFDAALTAPAAFKDAAGKSGDVAMMRLAEGERAFRADKNFIGVDLPFADARYGLVIVTSREGAKPLKEFGKAADWLTGEGFAPRLGDLALPRFAIAARADLLPALARLGLEAGLKSPTALAGFGGGGISQVLQRTAMEVDEAGAEAAAATAVIGTRSLESDDGLHMIVDRPFLYALRDKATGMMLMAGYVGHAPKGKAP